MTGPQADAGLDGEVGDSFRSVRGGGRLLLLEGQVDTGCGVVLLTGVDVAGIVVGLHLRHDQRHAAEHRGKRHALPRFADGLADGRAGVDGARGQPRAVGQCPDPLLHHHVMHDLGGMGAIVVGRLLEVHRESVRLHIGDAHDHRAAAVVGRRLGDDHRVSVGAVQQNRLRNVGQVTDLACLADGRTRRGALQQSCTINGQEADPLGRMSGLHVL